MGAGRALLCFLSLPLAAAAPGCATEVEDTASDEFIVVGTTPDVDAADAVETTDPELRVNAEADPMTCTEDSLEFVGINDDGTVAFEVPYSVTLEDDGSRIRFVRERTLPTGYRYAVVVKTGGATACTDVDGRPLQPYGFEFYVP